MRSTATDLYTDCPLMRGTGTYLATECPLMRVKREGANCLDEFRCLDQSDIKGQTFHEFNCSKIHKVSLSNVTMFFVYRRAKNNP